jgi:hypothetical protein
MELFDGLDHTDYQDVLRAVGHYLDQHRLREVRLLEVDRGVLVQGVVVAPSGERVPRSVLFPTAHLRDLLQAAYERRDHGRPVGTANGGSPTDATQAVPQRRTVAPVPEASALTRGTGSGSRERPGSAPFASDPR